MVHRLDPGQSYRFRVYAVNVDGIRGPPSGTVVVHTMLEVPPAPTVVVKQLGSKRVTIAWKRREQTVSSSRDKATVQKMLGDWAGSHGEDDGGVSIETAFARYDLDRSGTIEIGELELLLKDLGVEATEERKREAFALLDVDHNGVITYEEFGIWWRRDEVSYTIKRSDAILAVVVPDDREDIRSSTVNPILKIEKARSRARSAMRSSRDSLGASVGGSQGETSGRDGLGGGGGGGGGGGDEMSVHSVRSHHTIQSAGTRPSSAARARPSSAAGSHNGSNNGGNGSGDGGKRKMGRQVAMPIVCHRGPQTKCEIAGLEPNRL